MKSVVLPSAAVAQCLIRTEGLRVKAGSTEILKGISLDARRGEILSIIGPAGAGKTTFLRAGSGPESHRKRVSGRSIGL
jgi:ABC-type multidrug transport system ATPase subunit